MTETGEPEENDAPARLEAELGLLGAMYPDQMQWSPTSREFAFHGVAQGHAPGCDAGHGQRRDGSHLVVRLPESYPSAGLPMLLSATGRDKNDLRNEVGRAIAALGLNEGEEILDAIVQSFQERVDHVTTASADAVGEEDPVATPAVERADGDKFKTVLIWLHHLLATTKRKLALSPTVGGVEICGITKPGYPGIMLFSGPSKVLDTHVAELKSQRWQAFQIRIDEECEREDAWCFVHKTGIREVESMAEVVQGIVQEQHRQIFLQAAGVK